MGLVCGGNNDNVSFMMELVTVAVGAVAVGTAKDCNVFIFYCPSFDRGCTCGWGCGVTVIRIIVLFVM
jgi:hypothetical protein